jgi:hypothetical protein
MAGEGRREVHTVLLGKYEGRRELGIYRHIWWDNIKMDLKYWNRSACIGLSMLGTSFDHIERCLLILAKSFSMKGTEYTVLATK